MKISVFPSLLVAAAGPLAAWPLLVALLFPLTGMAQAPQDSTPARAPASTAAPKSPRSSEGVALPDLVDVTRFGAVADDGLDDAPAINAAIEFSQTAESKSKVVYLPSGVFDIQNTIHLGKGDRYSSVVLLGNGTPAVDPSFKGTRIKVHFDDKPAINVQGARISKVQGIALFGMNAIADNYEKVEDPSRWTKYSSKKGDRGMTSAAEVADGRYRGHFGITIDAFSGGGGEDSFVAPHGWNKHLSSTVEIVDCKLVNFVAGIVVHPSGSDGNGDFIDIVNTHIVSCKYGLSVGQTQARLANLTNCQLDILQYCLTTSHHGKQNGRINSATNCHFSGYQLGSLVNMSTNGPITFTACYAEQLFRIGFFGSPFTGSAPAVFIGCNFSLSHEQARSVPLTILEGLHAKFQDCVIAGVCLNMRTTQDNGEVVLDNTVLIWNANFQYDPIYHWETDIKSGRNHFVKKMVNHPLSLFGGGKLTIRNGTDIVSDRHYGGFSAKLEDVPGSNFYQKYVRTGGLGGTSGMLGDYFYKSPSTGMNALEYRTLVGNKLSFSVTDLGVGSHLRFLQPGDVLQCDNPGVDFMVTKRGKADGLASDAACEAVLLNGFRYDGNFVNSGYLFDTAALLDPATPFFWFHCNYYTTKPTVGVATTGSPVIANVAYQTRVDGQPAPESQFKPGSLIYYYRFGVTPGVLESPVKLAKVASTAAGLITLDSDSGLDGNVFIFSRYPY